MTKRFTLKFRRTRKETRQIQPRGNGASRGSKAKDKRSKQASAMAEALFKYL
jgi:hypothetical protein